MDSPSFSPDAHRSRIRRAVCGTNGTRRSATAARGWLAEAQGRFFLTFRANVQAPALATLRAGETTSIGSAAQTFTVSEVSSARPISAQGEIPYELVPDDEFYYADLSGPGGAFATIDYSEEVPVVFVGREVTLDESGSEARSTSSTRPRGRSERRDSRARSAAVQ